MLLVVLSQFKITNLVPKIQAMFTGNFASKYLKPGAAETFLFQFSSLYFVYSSGGDTLTNRR